MRRIASLTFKRKKKRVESDWSIIKDLKRLKVLYKQTVTMKELEDVLRKTKPYYLNEHGLSVFADGTEVDKDKAYYMWGILKGWETSKSEQLYVWMYKDSDGKFKYISYGTRKDFDLVIARNAANKETNKTE